MNRKIRYLNEFIEQLIKWYEEDIGETQKNDMSILKILKLLFLWAATNEEALNIFNNFEARPLGPVEVDIYNVIKEENKDLLFKITHTGLIRKGEKSLKWTEDPIIVDMIKVLKSNNPCLIKKSASQLVDITHKWDCRIIASLFSKKKITESLILHSKPHYF